MKTLLLVPLGLTAALTDDKLRADETVATASCFLDYRFVGVSALQQAGLGFKAGNVLGHWLPLTMLSQF
jgi:hypothetical protein